MTKIELILSDRAAAHDGLVGPQMISVRTQTLRFCDVTP